MNTTTWNMSNRPWPFVNSLAPGWPGCHFKAAIFNLILLIGIFISCKDNAPRWMPRDFTDDKSALVRVMAWCRQATSHYRNQCWSRSLPPCGVTRPRWVNKNKTTFIKQVATAKRMTINIYISVILQSDIGYHISLRITSLCFFVERG